MTSNAAEKKLARARAEALALPYTAALAELRAYTHPQVDMFGGPTPEHPARSGGNGSLTPIQVQSYLGLLGAAGQPWRLTNVGPGINQLVAVAADDPYLERSTAVAMTVSAAAVQELAHEYGTVLPTHLVDPWDVWTVEPVAHWRDLGAIVVAEGFDVDGQQCGWFPEGQPPVGTRMKGQGGDYVALLVDGSAESQRQAAELLAWSISAA